MAGQRTTSVAIGVIICMLTLYILLGPEHVPHLRSGFWRSQSGPLTTTTILDLTDAQLSALHASDPTLASASAYRQRLALLDRFKPYPDAHPHLGVASRIVVIGLERRADRRAHMETLRRAMGLEFEWSNAMDLSDPRISELKERVRWTREESRKGLESVVPELNFAWSDEVEEMLAGDVPNVPIGVKHADIWTAYDDPRYAQLPALPPVPDPDTRPVLNLMGGFNESRPYELRLAMISCWYSHYQVLRTVADGDDEVVIVFEDDIDMEYDLEKRLREMWPALPADWDVVMIGHCQSQEWRHPALQHSPALHRSTHTMCTHAYAISKRGAQKLVRFLRSEHFAYSRPIDHTFIHLGWHELIKIFSVQPPIVIQTKDNPSDIDGGTGGLKSEWLVDSVMERVQLWEKAKEEATKREGGSGRDHLRVR